MINLKNKNIIITGASGGIGKAIVNKLSEFEANILATGTKIEKLEELKSKVKNVKILSFDISIIISLVRVTPVRILFYILFNFHLLFLSIDFLFI